MRFLIITNHSYMLWQFRREFIEALLMRGEVIISTPFVGHEEDFKAMGCRCLEMKLERRGTNPFHEISLFDSYRKLLIAEHPDLVITYSIKPNLYAGLLCRVMKIPYCVNVQGLGTAFQRKSMAELVSALYREALKKARRVFFENKENARFFIKKKILPVSKITVLPGAGVDLEWYRFKEYPSEENGIRFLYLGRIMREKGMDEFFSAVRRLKKEFGNNVQFDLVGFFEDDYKQTVDMMSQKGLISFYGFQEDSRPWYASAHCVVLPSWHEGMSNVLLEAASTGRALITSDIPGCREAVSEGENGFLTSVRDADSLYKAMKSFMELSAKERMEMGKKGREKMEREFDRKRVVDRILRVLHIS